jgi:hypothetical protein
MQVEQPSNKATNNENTNSDQLNNQVNKTDSNKKNIVVKKSG